MKNSDMVFQTVLNEPFNLDVRRGYIDALIEEDNPKGELLLKELGTSFKLDRLFCPQMYINGPRTTKITEQAALVNILLPDIAWMAVRVEEGFVTHILLTRNAFLDCAEELFKMQPLTSVQFVDHFPEEVFSSTENFEVHWYNAEYFVGTSGGHSLNRDLFVCFFETEKQGFYCLEFADADLALQSASNAFVRYGRRKANLRELEKHEYLPGEFINDLDLTQYRQAVNYGAQDEYDLSG